MNKELDFNMLLFRHVKDGQPKEYEIVYSNKYAIFCYVALRHKYVENYVLKKEDSILVTTPLELYNNLANTNKTRIKDYTIRGIKQGLELLQKANIISYEIKGTKYHINIEQLFIDHKNEMFFKINVDYIRLIFEQKNPIDLLYHYMFLCSTINVKSHIGKMTRCQMSDFLKMDLSTVSRHHKKFKELGIIAFSDIVYKRNKDGAITNSKRSYTYPKYAGKLN